MESKNTETTSKPATVRILATNGGFRTFVAFFAAMLLFVIVFLIGIGTGVAGFAAAIEDQGMVSETTMTKGSSTTIAVLDIYGVIDGTTSAYATEAVNAILENENVRGVVLRIDSPGGGDHRAADAYIRCPPAPVKTSRKFLFFNRCAASSTISNS